jgi:hypothetical protein
MLSVDGTKSIVARIVLFEDRLDFTTVPKSPREEGDGRQGRNLYRGTRRTGVERSACSASSRGRGEHE